MITFDKKIIFARHPQTSCSLIAIAGKFQKCLHIDEDNSLSGMAKHHEHVALIKWSVSVMAVYGREVYQFHSNKLTHSEMYISFEYMSQSGVCPGVAFDKCYSTCTVGRKMVDIKVLLLVIGFMLLAGKTAPPVGILEPKTAMLHLLL